MPKYSHFHYVAIQDGQHKRFTDLARDTPLEVVRIRRKPFAMVYSVGDNPHLVWRYSRNSPCLIFDALSMSERCLDYLRSPVPHSFSMFSSDLLNWGVGLPRQFPSLHGDLRSRHIVVFGTIIARRYPTDYDPAQIELWESTNILPGNEVGELQQIYNRRNQISFLQSLVVVLNREAEYESTNFADRHIQKAHRALQSKWERPPRNRADLLSRVDCILSGIVEEKTPSFADYGTFLRLVR